MKINHKTFMKNLVKTIAIFLFTIWISSCSDRQKDTAFITTATGLQYKILKQGKGKPIVKGQEVLIHETTKYRNDSLVFSSRDLSNPLKVLVGGNQVIKGLDEGLKGMKKGEIRKLIVPPILSKRTGNITFPHPDSTLVYEIELIDVVAKKSTIIEQREIVAVDTVKSLVKWTGFYALKFDKHFGTVKLKNGKWYLSNGIISGGEFYIDMNTIINTDGEYNEMLVDHLKNEDFFETDVYPISKLEIVKMDYAKHPKIEVEANLTIKGVTQPILFSGSIEAISGQTIFKSQVSINRTRWNIKYGSGSFYDNLGDDVISDDIEFDIEIYMDN